MNRERRPRRPPLLVYPTVTTTTVVRTRPTGKPRATPRPQERGKPACTHVLPNDFWYLLFQTCFADSYDHYPTFLRLSKGVRNRVIPHLDYGKWICHVITRRVSAYVMKSPSNITRRTPSYVYSYTLTKAEGQERRTRRIPYTHLAREVAHQELLLDSMFVKTPSIRRAIALYLCEEARHLVHNEARAIHLREYLPNPLTVAGGHVRLIVTRRRVKAH